MFENADIIHVHTRADLIADGDLIDVTETAREAGILFPTALSRAVWENCVAWSAETAERKPGALQDESGRLWDVLWCTRYALKKSPGGSSARVEVWRVPADGDEVEAAPVQMWVHCGPGDQAEPVLTVMMPDED